MLIVLLSSVKISDFTRFCAGASNISSAFWSCSVVDDGHTIVMVSPYHVPTFAYVDLCVASGTSSVESVVVSEAIRLVGSRR